MALYIVVKNTFLDVDESDESGSTCGSTRRSSSVPRTWKPFDGGLDDVQRGRSTLSIGSTAASEGDLSDGNAATLRDVEAPDDSATPPTPPKGALNPAAAEFHMPPAPEAPGARAAPGTPSRLNPEARAFQPAPPQLPPEISSVVAASRAALLRSPHVTGVKVAEAPLGQATTVVADVRSTAGPAAGREALATAKAALLGAAARSQMTYCLGYTAVPFQDLCDSGFKGVIGSVPPSMQDSVCWDTYQKGFCPRRSLCRWYHPMESDLAPIRVILRKAAEQEAGSERAE